jgi:hypothetical protein
VVAGEALVVLKAAPTSNDAPISNEAPQLVLEGSAA